MSGALAGAVLLLGAVAAMAPPTGMDTLIFHFVAVKRWAAEGGLIAEASPYFHRTGGFYFPYLLAFVLHGDLLAKLLNFAAGAAAVALAGATGERLKPGAGAPAAAAAALAPVVGSYLGAQYLELAAQLYVSAAVYAAVRAREDEGGFAWAAAGLAFLGCALGVKNSAFAAVFLAPAFLVHAGRRGGRRALPGLALGGTVALVMGGFWPLWNVLSAGSAFPEYELGRTASSSAPVAGAGLAGGVASVLASLLTSSRHYWSESLGPLLVVGLAAAALFDLRKDGRFLTLQAALAAAGYLALLCAVAPGYLRSDYYAHVRYLSPVLVPLAAPAAGLMLKAAWDGSPALRRLAVAALLLPAAALLPLKAGRTAFAAPAALGLQPAGDYLGSKIETYRACEAVNRLPGDVLVLPLVLRPYHLDRPWVYPRELASETGHPDRFRQALRARSVTHVLVEPRAAEHLGVAVDDRLFASPFLREIGEGWPHWDGRRIRLYEVVDE